MHPLKEKLPAGTFLLHGYLCSFLLVLWDAPFFGKKMSLVESKKRKEKNGEIKLNGKMECN